MGDEMNSMEGGGRQEETDPQTDGPTDRYTDGMLTEQTKLKRKFNENPQKESYTTASGGER